MQWVASCIWGQVSVWHKFGSHVVKCVVAQVCSGGRSVSCRVVIVQYDAILRIVGVIQRIVSRAR